MGVRQSDILLVSDIHTLIKHGGPRLGSSQDDVPTAASRPVWPTDGHHPVYHCSRIAYGNHACRCAVNTVRTRPRSRSKADESREIDAHVSAVRRANVALCASSVGRWKFGAVGIFKTVQCYRRIIIHRKRVCRLDERFVIVDGQMMTLCGRITEMARYEISRSDGRRLRGRLSVGFSTYFFSGR